MNEELERKEAEQELLRASLLGDIREDIQFLGLTLPDIVWIILATLVLSGLVFFFPLGFLLKLAWMISVFLGTFVARYLKWPYLFKRWRRFRRTPKAGTGEQLPDLLRVKDDAWLYKSGDVWQMVVRIEAPPWHTSILDEKRSRLGGYERLLRSAIKEGFELSVTAEQVPDFCWELWQAKADKPKATEGIARRSASRLRMWEGLARSGDAKRSEYTVRLAIPEYKLSLQQRDDEPDGLGKAELRRHRILTELRGKKNHILSELEASGHVCTVLSGYAVTELLGRHWDPITWRSWKSGQGTWEEVPASTETIVPAPTDEETHVVISGSNEEGTSKEQESETKEIKQGLLWRQWLLNIGTRLIGSCRWALTKLRRIVASMRSRYGKRGHVPATTETLTETITEAMTVPVLPVAATEEATICDQVEDIGSEIPVVLVTAPAPTGKTFIAANMAVASASPSRPVTLLDLCPDRGTLSVINPVETGSEDGWQTYASRAVPGLTVMVPTSQEAWSPARIRSKMVRLAETSLVIADLSWHYPWRDEMLELGLAVAVVDGDYHHWTVWEEAAKEWRGQVWQNGRDIDVSPLVSEHFNLQVARVLPWFAEAKERLFQGRPLALEEQHRLPFSWPKGGGIC